MQAYVLLRSTRSEEVHCAQGALRSVGQYYVLETAKCAACMDDAVFCAACGLALETVDEERLLRERRIRCGESAVW